MPKEKQNKSGNQPPPENSALFGRALSGLRDGLWEYELSAKTFTASSAWNRIVGEMEKPFQGDIQFWMTKVHPDDISAVEKELSDCSLGSKAASSLDHRLRTPSGQYIWAACRIAVFKDDNGDVTHLAGTLEDVTRQKLAEKEFVKRAYYHPLTNLANRDLFLDRLRQALNRTKRRKENLFAVLFIDVDRFKVINDSLGHLAGDQLLVILARRLEKCLRPEDTIGHFGGDEFIVLVEDLFDRDTAHLVADRLRDQLSQPCSLEDHQVVPTVSIGIAIGSRAYEVAEDLLRDADTALYKAKDAGRDRSEIFGVEMHDRALARLRTESELREALLNGHLEVYYQPIIRIVDAKITGFEALVRWNHPSKGLIPPLDFIPLAEETGLIVPLGEEVLRQACGELTKWRKRGYETIKISVNVSARQFQAPGFVNTLNRILSQNKVSSKVVELEITESVTMQDVSYSIGILRELALSGKSISIDDFGTGYSSLAYLKKLPLHTLKIDRSFIKDATESSDSAAIVKAIIAMAHSLKLQLIAEGVETREHLELLHDYGCDHAQGFLYSPPVRAPEAMAMLLQNDGYFPIDGAEWVPLKPKKQKSPRAEN